MWLHSKDERRLLQRYHVNIGEVGKQHDFSLNDLFGFIKSNSSIDQSFVNDSQYDEKTKAFYEDLKRVESANKALKERGLIASSNAELEPSSTPITISLTITGYDLGGKYNSLWLRIKLWYEEYIKNHPIWLIISYIAGIISMWLVNWLPTLFAKNTGW